MQTVDFAIKAFLDASDEPTARNVASEHSHLLLTAYAEARLAQIYSDDSLEQDFLDRKRALLHQIRLETQKPRQWGNDTPAYQPDLLKVPTVKNEAEFDARETLTYDRCQFGNGNIMINNLESIQLQWRRPTEISSSSLISAVGRSTELTGLHELLQDQSLPSAISIHGLPAIGKTTLVALFARLYQQEYSGGIIWLQYSPYMTTQEHALVELRRAARYAYDANPEAADILENRYVVDAQVIRGLWTGHGRLLIIVDDVWSIDVVNVVREAIPNDSHVLMTTRDIDIARRFVGGKAVNIVELDTLNANDSRTLVHEIYSDIPEALCEKLISHLNGYAQALSVAASTLERNKDKGLLQLENDCNEIIERVNSGEGFGNLPEIKDELRREIRQFESVLKYSYDRLNYLSPSYPQYFRALGTLAEGVSFDSEAFAAICKIDDGANVLREFRQLGLVKAITIDNGAPSRWLQHPVLRAYSLGLQTPDERLTFTKDHALYFARTLNEASKVRLAYKLFTDLPNLRSAFLWSLKQMPPLVTTILFDMNQIFEAFNLAHEYFKWVQEFVQEAEIQGDYVFMINAKLNRALANNALSPHEHTHEARYSRLIEALSDLNDILALAVDEPILKAGLLNIRAVVQSGLANLEASEDKRRDYLLAAIQDYDEALPLIGGEPLTQIRIRFNRATEQVSLAQLEPDFESKRNRLFAALSDYDTVLPSLNESPFDRAHALNNRANLLCALAPLELELADRRKLFLEAYNDFSSAIELAEDIPAEKARALGNRAQMQMEIAEFEPDFQQFTQHLNGAYQDATDALALTTATTQTVQLLQRRADISNRLADLNTDADIRKTKLFQALDDCNLAIALVKDSSSEAIPLLNQRAILLTDFAQLEVTFEDQYERLRQAFADFSALINLASSSTVDVSIVYGNRANVQMTLAGLEATPSDRHERLLAALKDYDLAILSEKHSAETSGSFNGRGVVQNQLSEFETTLAGKQSRLSKALDDFNKVVELHENNPIRRGHALANRAMLYVQLAENENAVDPKRMFLFGGLADTDSALQLLSNYPSDVASVHLNRSTVLHALSRLDLQLDERNSHLAEAVTSASLAMMIFGSTGQQHNEMLAQLGLLQLAISCGNSLFRKIWQEVYGTNIIPEFDYQVLMFVFYKQQGIQSDEELQSRLSDDASFRDHLEDLSKLASRRDET